MHMKGISSYQAYIKNIRAYKGNINAYNGRISLIQVEGAELLQIQKICFFNKQNAHRVGGRQLTATTDVDDFCLDCLFLHYNFNTVAAKEIAIAQNQFEEDEIHYTMKKIHEMS